MRNFLVKRNGKMRLQHNISKVLFKYITGTYSMSPEHKIYSTTGKNPSTYYNFNNSWRQLFSISTVLCLHACRINQSASACFNVTLTSYPNVILDECKTKTSESIRCCTSSTLVTTQVYSYVLALATSAWATKCVEICQLLLVKYSWSYPRRAEVLGVVRPLLKSKNRHNLRAT